MKVILTKGNRSGSHLFLIKSERNVLTMGPLLEVQCVVVVSFGKSKGGDN